MVYYIVIVSYSIIEVLLPKYLEGPLKKRSRINKKTVQHIRELGRATAEKRATEGDSPPSAGRKVGPKP